AVESTRQVHILFSAETKTDISKFINAHKSTSSSIVKKEFPQIHKSLWKEYFWSPSFCLLTAVGAHIEVIKRYIKSQGKCI
ncbi:MAG: IS200/IS605 family transposase, partial [Christensenellaceae bacterium]|nr:IS200/IS605 family transposase [Christensenellaceae bacterium]